MGGFGKDPIPGFRAPAPAPRQTPPSAPVVTQLRVLNGPCVGRAFDLNGQRIRIGRADPPAITVDIDLELCELGSPAMISRRHAEMLWIDGTLHIVDLGSRNGTWVNDQPIMPAEGGVSEPMPLAAGSKIRLANLEFEINGPAPAEKAV